MFLNLKVCSVVILIFVSGSLQRDSQTKFGNFVKGVHPDAGLNAVELVKKHGYPIEQHKNIETKDGYLLQLHRIPRGRLDRIPKSSNSSRIGPPVLLMHGILCSSADWVNMGPGKSLAYLLADEGYDVWMGNTRGNSWSRHHVKYNPDTDSRFWDFSWHEMGLYDLPAFVDYILGVTKREQLFYVGHSQGTTAFYVMASELPQYNSKIRLMVSLAPVAFMSEVPSLFIRILAKFKSSLHWVAKFLGLHEFLPHSDLISELAHKLCHDDDPLQEVCSEILFLIAGIDNQLNRTAIPVILSNTPAGAATKQFIHFAQNVNSGDFGNFDHGTWKNVLKYGRAKPGVYNLKGISTPVALFYGGQDHLASVGDVKKLARSLSNLAYTYKLKDFGHLDFLWGVDAPERLYRRIMKLFSKFYN